MVRVLGSLEPEETDGEQGKWTIHLTVPSVSDPTSPSEPQQEPPEQQERV